jgi:hypothetical protein
MKKFLCALLLCAQFCFAPVEVPVKLLSGDTVCTITVSDNNTPPEVRQALYLALGIPPDDEEIVAGKVCAFANHKFQIDTLDLDELENSLTQDSTINYVKSDQQILVMPLFPYCNLTVAFIGNLMNFNSSPKSTFSNYSMKLKDYINFCYFCSGQTGSTDFYSNFWRHEYAKEMVHEISIYTEEIRLIQPEYELILEKNPNRAEKPNCETIETWPPDSDQNLTPCYTFSARDMFASLIFLIRNGREFFENLDYNQRITQDHLDGDTPREPTYRKQPWVIIDIKEHQSPLYHERLPTHVPARQPTPQILPPAAPVLTHPAQISHTQYISNALRRFVEFICPNT